MGLGIFTYLKITAAVVILSVCGYYVYNYHHMATKIAAQELEIANLKLGQDVLDKKQQTFDNFMAKSTQIKRRVKNEQTQIDKEVGTTDDAGLKQLYDRYRLRPQGQIRPATP